MDAAKASVKKVLGRSGQHDTTIHETVAPAVQNETVTQQQHERQTQAIDREVHQDHYHISEQPVKHSEVLPEQHHHREAPIEQRTFDHDNAEHNKARVAEAASAYRDQHTRVEGESTRSMEPTVSGEHKHHHVHETIQPIIHKQTVEPHVVHTTVPVHEIHHNEAQHHSASALPAVSMDDFKKQGGSLTGREERHDHFEGEPRAFGGQLKGHGGQLSNATKPVDGSPGAVDHGRALGDKNGYSSGDRVGTDGDIGRDTGYGSSGVNQPSDIDRTIGTNDTKKPSMMDKLNPKVDATGDGKAGFMK